MMAAGTASNLDKPVATAVVIILGWIFSVCLHEFGHAAVAYWGGDRTVKEKGYLTLNPSQVQRLFL